MNDQLEIFWPNLTPPDIWEVKYSYEYCKETTRCLCKSIPGLIWKEYPAPWELHQFIGNSVSDLILIITDPESVLSYYTIRCLINGIHYGFNICGPAYNLTDYPEQLAHLPTAYLNVTSYVEIARYLSEMVTIPCPSAKILDPACILYRRDYLESIIDADDEKKSSGQMAAVTTNAGIASGALVHRFGSYYNGERKDLVDLVPSKVRSVLDIGCAKGGYGKYLKKVHPDIRIVGVELNSNMAEFAKHIYDAVFVIPVEQLEIDEKFDLVNCGDILEHLNDPWQMLKRIATLLNDGGYLVLSIPNAGHWTVIKDLLDGKFEYLPIGLLCITHLRWFTESSIRQALADAGLSVDIIIRQQVAPTPEGEKCIQAMCDSGYGCRETLLTNEIVIRAKK